MTTTARATDPSQPTAASLAVSVGPLQESELDTADRILRDAFGTFLGVPDVFGDADYVWSRWHAAPDAAFGARVDGGLIGSNYVTRWGSVGFFGPLSVRPDLWDRHVAQQLLVPTMELLSRGGTRLAGLFTFAHSAKHVGLYQKFGFWPQHLTAIMAKPVQAPTAPTGGWSVVSELAQDDHTSTISACAELTGTVFEGLDVRREIEAVARQGLGETVLVDGGDSLEAVAVCHLGARSEAGSGACYVKVAAARAGAGAAARFQRLLDACEELASARGATALVAGVSTARHEAYRAMLDRGFRTQMQGVAMHRPNEPGYSRPGVFLIDDWR